MSPLKYAEYLQQMDKSVFRYNRGLRLEGSPSDWWSIGENERRLKILYENENLVAVEKPAGIIMHPNRRSVFLNVTSQLALQTLQETGKAVYYGCRTRLDGVVSGVCFLYKGKWNQETKRWNIPEFSDITFKT